MQTIVYFVVTIEFNVIMFFFCFIESKIFRSFVLFWFGVIAVYHRWNRGLLDISMVRFKSATAESSALRPAPSFRHCPSVNVFVALLCFFMSSKCDLNASYVWTTARPSLFKRFKKSPLFMATTIMIYYDVFFGWIFDDSLFQLDFTEIMIVITNELKKRFALACSMADLPQSNITFFICNFALYTA